MFIQPSRPLVEETCPEVCYAFRDQAPVQAVEETAYQVKQAGQFENQQSASLGEVNLRQCHVEELTEAVADFRKVCVLEEIISRLDNTVQTVAELLACALPVNRVNRAVDFVRQHLAQPLPVPFIDSVFQGLCKVGYAAVDLLLCEHTSVVRGLCSAVVLLA